MTEIKCHICGLLLIDCKHLMMAFGTVPREWLVHSDGSLQQVVSVGDELVPFDATLPYGQKSEPPTEPKPAPKITPVKEKRTLQPCGTKAAYKRHLRLGERPCFECSDANRVYERARYNGEIEPRELEPCGTTAGWSRHYRRGEPPCDDCLTARKLHRRKEPRQLKPCGTISAYVRHIQKGEKPCPECAEANREYQRQRRQAMKAAAMLP